MVLRNTHHFALLEEPLSYSKPCERKSKNYPYEQNCLCRFVRGYGHTHSYANANYSMNYQISIP